MLITFKNKIIVLVIISSVKIFLKKLEIFIRLSKIEIE